ncbi:unnamed protein product [Cuscuta europaea]|uniref:DUF4283 domain-containing protein n=1 Tax=Cuscuta europaea TaxID=41803 RepID=A0A9P0Z995_CUSEU|nr:unnamed protein product [Cuscuta europaea]
MRKSHAEKPTFGEMEANNIEVGQRSRRSSVRRQHVAGSHVLRGHGFEIVDIHHEEIEALAQAYGNMEMEEGYEAILVEAENSGASGANLTFIGTITSEKPVHFSIFRDSMASVWKPVKGLTITDIGTRRYMFYFYHECDMLKVTLEGPWLFDQNMIVLKKLEEDLPLTVALNKTDFWIQVYAIPTSYFSLKMLKE